MGLIFKIPAIIIFYVAVPWGLFILLGIFADQLGFIGGLLGVLFFPLTLVFAPWYAGFADGDWLPLILVYGGGIAAHVLVRIGSAMDDIERDDSSDGGTVDDESA